MLERIGDIIIAEIVDAIMVSKKKDEIMDYIMEVAEKCADLCYVDENVRVLNEYKILINNLIKMLKL